jgi:hypothetical protein
VLDLARWQRRMQNLAPSACYLALAVTLTQLFDQTALGIGLLFVSGLAVGASDLRIAGRLPALKMEMRSTKKFSDYADEQYEILLQSLRPAVQRRVAANTRGWNVANVVSFFVACILVSLEAPAIMLSWLSDPVYVSRPIHGDFSDNLDTLLLLWVVLFTTTGGAVWTMIYAAAGRLVRHAELSPIVSGIAGVGSVARWGQWILVVVAVALPSSFPAILGLGPASTFLSCLIVLICCAAQYLLIRLAVKTGRGPGMAAVWLALANRAEDKRLAGKQFDEAKAAHQEAEKRQDALADAAQLQAQRMQAAVAVETTTANINPRSDALTLLQRILVALNGNGAARQ